MATEVDHFVGMPMVNRVGRVAVVGGLVLLAGVHRPAVAADMAPVYKAPPPVVVNPWKFDITPYGWTPSLNGSTTIKGHVYVASVILAYSQGCTKNTAGAEPGGGIGCIMGSSMGK